jgi:hypothetical protein
MNTRTRAKFLCQEVKRTATNGHVKLTAVHDSAINNEDNAFNKATPNGTLEMVLYPVEKADFFTPGKAYYLDITEVEAA